MQINRVLLLGTPTFKMFKFFIVALLASSLTQVKGQNDDCVCKSTEVFTDTLYEQRDFILDAVYASLNNWTPLGEVFRSLLLVLQLNEDSENFLYSVANLQMLSAINPFLIQYPGACALKKIIDASISCARDADSTTLYNELRTDSLRNYLVSLIDFDYVSANAALVTCELSGDEYVEPQIPGADCDSNGFQYDLEAVWQLFGQRKNISSEVIDVLRLLYNSEDYKDFYIAVVATFNMLDISQQILNNFGVNELLEYRYLPYSPEYPDCCCDTRKARISYLRNILLNENSRGFDNLNQFYSNPNACQPVA